MRNSKVIRKFERLLFDGVPEQPESAFERDDYSHVSMRKTGKSSLGSTNDSNSFSSESEIIGYFTYDFEKGSEKYTKKDRKDD